MTVAASRNKSFTQDNLVRVHYQGSSRMWYSHQMPKPLNLPTR